MDDGKYTLCNDTNGYAKGHCDPGEESGLKRQVVETWLLIIQRATTWPHRLGKIYSAFIYL